MGFLDSLLDVLAGNALKLRLQWLGAEMGLRFQWSELRGIGAFAFERAGRHYSLLFKEDGEMVAVTCVSQLGFRTGTVPRDLVEFLAAEGSRLDYASWDLLEDGDETNIYMTTTVAFASLDAHVVQLLIERVVTPVIALDETLVKRGLAQYWRSS